MEFMIIFSLHFFIMGSLVLLISGAITFICQRVHFIFVVLLSMLAGFFYTLYFEVINELALFVIFFNAVLSIIAMGLVKLGLYMRKKAEELNLRE
ncbi:hypothetical protein CVD25_11425 [Bacillus canaveralius]|uniref:Uncharacterized protein n=1 Tax=Bacillus canaveralius TaxID=1403243 RepID=A0A2N5GK94_9BACI|nr:hypothetical protein [Bacillus canaveralius]PLR81773.1 hypothetical protein CU635_14145 [Bacillus canaveralius]PLR96719.1 hypothetical protein CVD25_11425 [Bacillus canaveralius]